MRNSDLTSSEFQSESAPRATGWETRTFNDATSLLLELSRAHRGFAYYDETSPARETLADRAFRALSSEIQRAGPIEILLDDQGLRLQEFAQYIRPHGVQHGFEDALRSRGLLRLSFSGSLTLTALKGFLDQLVRPADRFGSLADFARNLAARDARGIALNEGDRKGEETKSESTARVRSLDETPLRAAATAGSHIADEAEGIDADPLAMRSPIDRGERLRARLIELDHTADDETYQRRASEIVVWAEELSNEGYLDDCYRAEVVLSDHAVGGGGRGEVQARVAAASFAELASGIRLEDLVERAASPDSHPIRPSQMLLQLGEVAAPVILERLFNEDAGAVVEALEPLLMTLGEVSLPALIEAIRGQDDRRAQIAIRLAGRIQSPKAYPALLDAVQSQALGRRVDAIRALSFLPGEEPKEALENALQSDLEEIAIAATQAFATNDRIDAVPTLLDALDVSLHSHRTQLSRSLIEVLGRLGDERAVPRLSAALERKPMIRRAHWHAAQIAAVDALAILPTKEARRSIERAALYGAAPIQDRARARLSASRSDAPDTVNPA